MVVLLTAHIMGCSSDNTAGDELLPSSRGDLAELVIIYDKKRSTPDFKEKIREAFGQKLNGVVPEEYKFKLLFSDETFFKGYFKLHHNVFVLLNNENLETLVKTYGENNKVKIRELIHKEGVLGYNKDNVWAKNQNVFYVLAASEEEMLEKMKNRSEELMEIASAHERNSGVSMVFNESMEKDTFYQSHLLKKGYSVRKPISYRLALETENFCWLRKESSKFDYGILMYHVPYTSQNQFNIDSIIALRTSFTRKFIPGEPENSYMSVSKAIKPHYAEVNFNDHYAINVRAWWDVVGDFMGGPFVSYVVYDKKNQRLVVVEGFVYGPNKSKAKPLREVELIVNSLRIQ